MIYLGCGADHGCLDDFFTSKRAGTNSSLSPRKRVVILHKHRLFHLHEGAITVPKSLLYLQKSRN
ncbi:hypothetical protein BFS14_17145 [Serratia fonticola]|nr:hypothetical protein BFS14_17145 [Serratia fonticola]